jgi:hypothetical protein
VTSLLLRLECHDDHPKIAPRDGEEESNGGVAMEATNNVYAWNKVTEKC